MNEFLFFCQIALVVGFAMGALKLGKEALSSFVVLQALLANLFITKQMLLFGFHVTCSDVFAIGSILGLNMLQEHFGKDSVKKTAWICFYFMLFFALVSQLHLLYVPSPSDTAQAAFLTIFSSTPRLLAASLVVFFLVQQWDFRFFAFLKKHIPSWPLRNFFALLASQLLDTLLFSLLGLYGIVTSITHIIIVSFLLKSLIIFILGVSLAYAKGRVTEEM